MTPSLPFTFPRQPAQGSTPGLQSASAILESAGLTRRRLKKLDAIVQVHERQCVHKEAERAYSARPFVLCGIPVRRPAKSTLEYSRQNGRFKLRVIGHPEYGLPFGQDRLLLIWIATMATWQKTREIRFRSAAAILETFSLPKDGRYYKRLIAGFERIFYATFFFSSDQQVGEATLMERQSFRFVRDAKLWYAESGSYESPLSSQARTENAIMLSEEFWKEIQEHPIPVDLAIVKALADSPGTSTSTSGWSGAAGRPKRPPRCLFSGRRVSSPSLAIPRSSGSVTSAGKSSNGSRSFGSYGRSAR